MSKIPLSKVRRAAGLVFLSGELPFATDGSIPAGIEAQATLVIEKIAATLKREKLALENVVSVLVHLSDKQDFAPFNEVYRRYFKEPWPTRTTVSVNLLAEGALLEITVVAAAYPDA